MTGRRHLPVCLYHVQPQIQAGTLLRALAATDCHEVALASTMPACTRYDHSGILSRRLSRPGGPVATSDSQQGGGDRPGDVSNQLKAESVGYSVMAGEVHTINMGGVPQPADGLRTENDDLKNQVIRTQGQTIASQEDQLVLYRERCETFKVQIEQLGQQRDKAYGVIASLRYVSVLLGRARRACRQELDALGSAPGLATATQEDAELRNRRRGMEDRLRSIEALLDGAQQQLSRAQDRANRAEELDRLLQVEFEAEHPDEPLPDDVSSALVPVTTSQRFTIPDHDLLDRSQAEIDKGQAKVDEIDHEMEQIESTLPAAVVAEADATNLRQDLPEPKVAAEPTRRWYHRDGKDAKLQRENTELRQKLSQQQQTSAGADSDNLAGLVAAVLLVTFLLSVIAMLATGILIHAAPRIQSASPTEHLVVLALAAILLGAPIVGFYNWSKDSAPVAAIAAALWIAGVIASYLYAIVALLVAVILMFTVVLSRVGVAFVIGTALAVLLAAVAPNVLWWPWTALGGLTQLF